MNIILNLGTTMENKKEEHIVLTKDKIKEIFKKCNELYFNNEIEEPDFYEIWTYNRKCVGWVRVSWNKKLKRKVTYLQISSWYIWTEENLTKVILHEMIHLATKDFLKKPTFWEKIIIPFFGRGHKKDFTQKMNEINEKYNLNIQTNAKFMKQYLLSKH